MPARSKWARRALSLPGAVARSFPGAIAPQLPTLVQRAPLAGEWLFEIKWDGYRISAGLHDGKAIVWTRNLHDWTRKLSWLAKSLEALPVKSVLFDGEAIAGRGRKDDFELLQGQIAKGKSTGLTFVAFDVLYLDGVDLRSVPQIARKELLSELLDEKPKHFAVSTHAVGNAAEALKLTQAGGYEGVVIKRANSSYASGRSEDWLKIKHVDTEELAVVGYMRSSAMRTGAQVLLLAKPGTTGWVYAGRVKGLGDADSQVAAKLIGKRGAPEPTVEISPAKAKELAKDDALWFPPLFVVEVLSRGSTASRLRQPTFKSFRPDKSVDEL
jgi:bifunctional non-homologous end joining protein LigD